MFHKFLKYISQSISGMIGVSIYILADTFLSLTNAAQMDLLPESDPSGIRTDLRNRFDDRDRFCHTLQYQYRQRCTFGLLFYPSIFWCLICSIPFMLTGIFIPHKALALLGADAGLIRLGRNYMRIVLLFTPFFMSNYTFTAFARNDHATSIAMIGSIFRKLL